MKRKWLANLGLFLPAALISVVIWLIAKQGDTKTDIVSAPVDLLKVPANIEARAVPPRIEVTLLFPKTFMEKIMEPGKVRVRIPCDDLPDLLAGGQESISAARVVTPVMVDMGDLPGNIRVQRVAPEQVTIDVRLHVLAADIRPQCKGTPKSGFELRSVRASPARVRLTGAPATLAQLRDDKGLPRAVETEPLDISNADSDQSMLVRLTLPEGVSRIDGDRSPLVEVTAEIREQIVTETIRAVEIRYPYPTTLHVAIQPSTTDVKVTGPRSLVKGLTADSFRFEPDTALVEEPGRTQFLRFFPRFRDESLEDTLRAEAVERTVAVTFEENRPPAPTPTPGAPELY